MNITNILEQLADKRHALELLVAQRISGENYRSLSDEVLGLERRLAECRGEAYVIEWNFFGLRNNLTVGPSVFGNELKCVVIFPSSDNNYTSICFSFIAGYKLTDVSDEIIDGHPLNGKGLTAYRAFCVRNSPWIEELKAIDRIHPQYSPAKWVTYSHYLLSFKDRMFEVIAQDARLLGNFTNISSAMGNALDEIRG